MPSLPILALLLTFTFLTAADDTIYCNITSPCRACGPKAREDVYCTETGYKQEATCISVGEGAKAAPHDIVKTDNSKRQYKTGVAVESFASCAPPTQWSVPRFEGAMVVMLLVSAVVIRWRQRR